MSALATLPTLTALSRTVLGCACASLRDTGRYSTAFRAFKRRNRSNNT